jgi:hypothetical protein
MPGIQAQKIAAEKPQLHTGPGTFIFQVLADDSSHAGWIRQTFGFPGNGVLVAESALVRTS